MEFRKRLEHLVKEEKLPPQIAENLLLFYSSYAEAIRENRREVEHYHSLLNRFLELIMEQLRAPYPFPPFHKSVRAPFDYYHFGLDFIRPLVISESSSVAGMEIFDQISSHLALGENVIFLANHQTEPDPQAISLLLEKKHPTLAEEMIFVAGHRVITDPMAVPFSKGRNLLCIFSKNYVEHPPELKHQKLLQNRGTMKKMRELLEEGGKCIYVAPSGGRDRPDSKGKVEVAPFNPQSIEMFRLIAEKASRHTRFYPLALATFDLFPPPNSILREMGERRHAKATPIHIALGPEIDMHHIPGPEHHSKEAIRNHRAEYAWNQVRAAYEKIRGKR